MRKLVTMDYTAPELLVAEIEVEQGFALSGDADYTGTHDGYDNDDWSGDYTDFQ